MKKDKCYSVRLQSMTKISDKCYKAEAFNGSSAFIPAQFVYGMDTDRTSMKSDSWWISAWILEQKDLQYSSKKVAYFWKDSRKRVSEVEVEVIEPAPIEAQPIEADETLLR